MSLVNVDLDSYPCEYIDIRRENLFCSSIRTRDYETETAIEETIETYFLRIFNKGRWFYTSFFDFNELNSKIKELLNNSDVFNQKRDFDFLHNNSWQEKRVLFNDIHPSKYKLSEKKKLLNDTCSILKNCDRSASNTGMYRDWYVNVEFASSDGVYYEYDKTWSGIFVYYILKNGDKRYQTSFKKCVKNFPELYQYLNAFENDINEALPFLTAESVLPKKSPVILSPCVAGVFAHESFGHKSESDFMLNDPKLLDDWKIGSKVANNKVSIIDDGNLITTGYCPFDDEGTKATKTYLINKGILSDRLHSRETAKFLGETPTGNARAISCEYEPLVRMTTTYFDSGEETKEELISQISSGFFIDSYKHGSGNSTFTIAPDRAYEIKNGKIEKPVLISVVTGNVFNTLNLISGVSNRVEYSDNIFGGCGKMGQFPLPVSHGGPCLLVDELQIS